MKKILMILLLLVLTAGQVQAALVYGADNYKKNLQFVRTNATDDPIRRFMVEVDAALSGSTVGDATIYYVNSNVSTEGDGTSWTNAKDTLDEAINLCSAGDFIYVAEAHAESGSAANLWDADVAGITIVHFGNGTRQGTYTFADTDTTVAIGAANVTVIGGRFVAGISGVVVGISVEAGGDNFTLIGAEFPEPSTSSFEFVRAILLATGADDVSIIGCDYANVGATGGTNFIDLDTGIVDGFTAIGNTIKGEFAEGAIHTDKVCTSMWIEGNVITNFTTGQHGIEIAANATGVLKDNVVSTDTIGASYDVGYLEELGINWWDDEGTRDTSPVPWTTNETGVNRWGATELAQIEGEATDAIEADDLDHLVKAAAGTDVYPVPLTSDSILAMIMCKGATATASTYNNTTDSLEAIADRDILSLAILDNSTTKAGHSYASVIYDVDSNDADLFDVDGGAILITSFTGLVTTEITSATNNMKIFLDADPGFVDYDFSTSVDTNGDLVGDRVVFDATVNESVWTPLTGADNGAAQGMVSWFCGEGMIEQDASDEDSAGAYTWYMTWIPYEDGTTVTAQ